MLIMFFKLTRVGIENALGHNLKIRLGFNLFENLACSNVFQVKLKLVLMHLRTC